MTRGTAAPGRTRPAVRLAAPGDVALLPAIELAAARLFERAGIAGAFLDEATDVADLAEAQRDGRLWIAVDAEDRPVGFALAVVHGGEPHLEEIDVHPDHGGRGLGTALVRAVLAWAEAFGSRGITLTTFRDVPWNAPFYERLGFRIVSDAELTPALREVVAAEAADGLPVERRIVMRRTLA